MKILWRSNLRYLARTWLITMVSLLSLAVGVASVILVHVLSERIVSQLDSSAGNYQYVLGHTSSQLNENDYFVLRSYWRGSTDSPVLGMVPVIEGWVKVDDRIVSMVGLDPVSDYQMLDIQHVDLPGDYFGLGSIVATGLPAIKDGLAWSLDGSVSVPVSDTRSGPIQRLTGDLPVAQELLHRHEEIDKIWLRVNEPSYLLVNNILPGAISRYPDATPTIHELFPEMLGTDLFVSSMGHWRPFRAFADSIAFNVSVLSALALFVSGFIVHQALFASFKNRTTEVTRLVTLGVSQAQIRRLYLAEAVGIGVVGSGAGVLLSLFLARFFLMDQIDGSLWDAFGIWSISKGMLLGIGSAFVAGMSATNKKKTKFQNWMLSLAIILIVAGLFRETGKSGAIGIIFGLCVFQLLVVTPLFVRVLQFLVGKFIVKGLVARSAFRGVVERVRELRVTSGALTIAMAAAVGMGLMVESFRQDFSTMLSQRIPSGLFLTDAASVETSVLSSLPGIKEVREYYTGQGTINNQPASFIFSKIDTWEGRRYGLSEEVQQGIFVNELAVQRYGLKVDDTVTVKVGNLIKALPVEHVFRDYGEPVVKAIVPVHLFDEVLPTMVLDQYTITLKEDASVGQVRSAIAREYQSISISEHNEIQQIALQVFDQTFRITDYLTIVAITVAVLGLYGAVLSTEAQRRRHMNLLRTMGVEKKVLVRVGVSESLVIGGLAVLLAIPLGLAIDLVLCQVLNPRAFGWSIEFEIYLQPILIPCILGLIASLGASTVAFFAKEKLITNRASYEL